MHKVLLVVGSDSDLPVMQAAVEVLAGFGVGCEIAIASAHRTPRRAVELAEKAEERGIGVIIAAAGGAAHLPGVLAAHTVLPVIGVPVKSGALAGVDALYSIVQMPPGIPVATVGIDAAKNAGLLAAAILAGADPGLRDRLKAYRREMARAVEAKDARLAEEGLEKFLAGRKKE